jgi:hypothetical protein
VPRKIYQPSAIAPPRRSEWVSLPDGDILVREMTVAEAVQVLERSARPSIDPRGGHSQGMTVALQLILSCYAGEEPDAARIFGDHDMATIYALPFRDFDIILQAINRVNGKTASEQETLHDFLLVRQEPSTF